MGSRFPNADLHLCAFHLAKSCFSQVQKKGLIPVYAIPQAKELLRCFPSLAFLPPAEVMAGYQDVVHGLGKLIAEKVIPERFKVAIKRKGNCLKV